MSLASGHVSLVSRHFKRRIYLKILLTLCVIGAVVFGCVLASVMLAEAIGLITTLALMAGVFVLAALIVLIVMAVEQKRHEARERAQREAEKRLAKIALVSALPALKGGGLLAAGAAAIALMIVMGRSGGDDDGE
ncbi:hypothetical protein X907_2011 [Glycocaulis alkaliphilus]|uniref:Uncharacterized protein n=1 Tax=Glycocaulis alkaliphilus TaxID=1434191 RepID=A0A3T0EB34_9PROT|nr:hypothetical protein [Glycocaulis alkaliphilus]AZU04534.1 hypothetical protein X907_2011 [Glycocaulis alkaliphilus]GGB79142.1 hypothetical protein GCM10007417_18830 [Glycocaulis alkaliphilus]